MCCRRWAMDCRAACLMDRRVGATEDQARVLLAALRERCKPLPAQRIGRIGPTALGYPGYASEAVIRKDRGGAAVPVMIEAWARCDGWKRRHPTITVEMQTFLN